MENQELIKQVTEKAQRWLTPAYDAETQAEVKRMLENEDKTELIDCFYKDLEFVGVEVKNMKNMENLTNDRLHTNGTKALYPTFVNIGDKEPVEGTSELFVLKFKARRDMKFQPKLTDGMVVDKKLNTKINIKL